MGSNDEMEICELVGFYLLNRLNPGIDKIDVRLYRDYGLAATNNENAQ